jgi:hypothetical protein
MVQLIGNRSNPRRPPVTRGRVGKPGRRGECGLVRVRPQPRPLLAGRHTECRVRRPRIDIRSRAQYCGLPCRRQDIRRLRRLFWGDRACGGLDGGGCRIQTRRGRRIGLRGFDFDAAVTCAGIDGQSFARTGKQKEGETKENDHGRCCDNAERDEVEQGADMGSPLPWCAHSGDRRPHPALWPTVDPRFGMRAVVPAHRITALGSVRLGIWRSPGNTPQDTTADGDRKTLDLVIDPVNPFRFCPTDFHRTARCRRAPPAPNRGRPRAARNCTQSGRNPQTAVWEIVWSNTVRPPPRPPNAGSRRTPQRHVEI